MTSERKERIKSFLDDGVFLASSPFPGLLRELLEYVEELEETTEVDLGDLEDSPYNQYEAELEGEVLMLRAMLKGY